MVTILGKMRLARSSVIATVLLISASITWSPVHSLGKRTFGDQCSIGSYLTSFLSTSGERGERTCDTDKGLICTGKCSCPIGRIWDSSSNFFGINVGSGRGCVRGAGSPCYGSKRNSQCVTNAHCEFAVCRCDSGFRQNGGLCILNSNSNSGGSNNVNINVPNFAPDLAGFFNNFIGNNNNNNNNNDNNNGNSNSSPSHNNDDNNNNKITHNSKFNSNRVIFRE
ncbi:unnamed protein product [Orchesella dallaii]|uniref:EB domain-containing protein n=1 Tax=Orchesella dallaii TaxID=48710 RepID=A0ABP1R830_9HEXA